MSWNNITPAWAINTKAWYVYAHINPITKAPFYIGKGCETRAYERQMRNKAWKHYNACLRELGLVFDIKVLHVCNTNEAALKLESVEISKAVKAGHMLVNQQKVVHRKNPTDDLTLSESLDALGVREFIRAERRKQKLTQKQLAKKCGLRQTTISKIESGAVSPTLPTIIKVLQGLDATLAIRK